VLQGRGDAQSGKFDQGALNVCRGQRLPFPGVQNIFQPAQPEQLTPGALRWFLPEVGVIAQTFE
jgi:hypothetical protein